MDTKELLKKFEFYTKFHIKEIYSLISSFKNLNTYNKYIVDCINSLCIDSIYTKNNIIYYRGYIQNISTNNFKYHSFQHIKDDIYKHSSFFTKYKGISFSIHMSKKLETLDIYTDRDKLLECICILLKNSVYNCSNKDSIKLYIKDGDDKIKFTMIDFGRGIKEKTIDYIFKSVIPESDFLGLGLFIFRCHVNSLNLCDINSLDNCIIEYSTSEGTKISFSIPNKTTLSQIKQIEKKNITCLIFIPKNYLSEKLVFILASIGYTPIRISTKRELRLLISDLDFATIFCLSKDIQYIREYTDKNIICVTKQNYIDVSGVINLSEPLISSDIKNILENL